jgi:hypothetical protein
MKREYVIKLTDAEKEWLRQSEMVKMNTDTYEGVLVYEVVQQILEQNNSAG